MRRNLGISCALTLLISACASYTPSSAPVPDFSKAPAKTSMGELAVSADPYGTPERQKKHFDANLKEKGIIAVLVGVSNNGQDEKLVRLNDIELTLPNGSRISPTTPNTVAAAAGGDGGVVGATIMFGIIGYLASASAQEEAQTARRSDYANKAFRDARLKNGQKDDGFVFYIPSPGTAPFDTATLNVRFVDVERGTSQTVNLTLKNIGYVGKLDDSDEASGQTASSESYTPKPAAAPSDRKAMPLPPGSIINFEADRAAIEEAVTNYYDMTGYSEDFPNSNNGAELYDLKALTMSKTEGDRIDVLARYTARFTWDGSTRSRASRFTLRKENNAYSVIAMKRL